MTLQQSVDLVGDPNFRGRVSAAVIATAFSVAGETPSARGFPTYWDKRSNLAQRILQGQTAPVDAFVWAVAANPSVAAAGTASDGDIEYVVVTNWNDVAGIGAEETP